MTDETRNDTGMPLDEALARLGSDAVEITWGEVTLKVERFVFDYARQRVGVLDANERLYLMTRIERSLSRMPKSVREARASKRRMDQTMKELVFWQALKEATSV